ncbi:MAG TPA: ABC transporter permease [Ilumatobacteraceae bacterium]|nr:ABC transporter permease [Ilumatobacteraceae bacterium]
MSDLKSNVHGTDEVHNITEAEAEHEVLPGYVTTLGTMSGVHATKRESVWSVIVPPLVAGVIILAVWNFISYGVLSESRRFLLKPPHEVARVGFFTWDNLSEMLTSLWNTAQIAIIGLIVATIIGLGLAIIMSQSKLLERAIFPYMVILQSMPILAIVPLIGFWFGYDKTARVMVCVLIAVFPILVNSLFGLLSADQGMHNLFTLHNANRWIRLRKLMFPAALPAIFTGLRISAGLAVIGAIVGDFLFGQGEVGIGQVIKLYAARLRGEELLAAVLLACMFGVVVFAIFGWIGNRVVGKWATQARS